MNFVPFLILVLQCLVAEIKCLDYDEAEDYIHIMQFRSFFMLFFY